MGELGTSEVLLQSSRKSLILATPAARKRTQGGQKTISESEKENEEGAGGEARKKLSVVPEQQEITIILATPAARKRTHSKFK